jgi:DNA-binding transcriptional LysR family regulator
VPSAALPAACIKVKPPASTRIALPDERFPLYALYPSRHHPPAKTRAFLELVMSLAPLTHP